jgi:OPA family glycerol-3-phosphate transporter-like MFS transporter
VNLFSSVRPRPGFYIREEKRVPLFCLLWASYFAANLGRLSYITIMIEIIDREGFSPAAAGLVGTGFFVCYGLGQIISGYIGDRLPPRQVVFAGLFCTALANLAMGFAQTSGQMLMIWCFNGTIQSVLWPPILRVIVEYYPQPEREKACVNIATTYPLATLFSYAVCAGIVMILSWRAVFIIFSCFLLAMSALWGVAFGKLERCRMDFSSSSPPANEGGGMSRRDPPGKRLLKIPYPVLAFFGMALIAQGALRDGLMSWIPAYMAGVFSLQTGMAILSAGVLPVINVFGIYACQFLFCAVKDEARTSLYLFLVSALCTLILCFFGGLHIVLPLFAFALVTACMMGINLMLVSFVPTHFSRMGKVSFLSGLTNSMVYLGSSLSSVGFGLAVEGAGWKVLPVLLSVLAFFGALLCFFAVPGWFSFVQRERTENSSLDSKE